MHVRLLATFDTIDELQSMHSEELAVFSRDKATLEKRTRTMRHQLEEALDERDDMRDAVERLAEKGL